MKCWYSINEPTYIFFYKGLYDFLIHFKEIFDAKDTLDISLCNQRSLFFSSKIARFFFIVKNCRPVNLDFPTQLQFYSYT